MSPILVLVGPPGSGKTTVGALLADRLGVSFRDTDADIEKLAGKAIPEIFVADGEEHFRALETQAIAAALAEHDGVLALGGGAVLAETNRRLLAEAPVAFLSVELSAAVNRVGMGAGRPLLALNPRATLKALLDQRRPLYDEVADITVATDALTPDQVAEELAAFTGAPVSIHVGGDSPYEVVIGREATIALTEHLDGAARVAILHAPPLREHARRVAAFVGETLECLLIEVPDAESAKTVAVAEDCWNRLGQAGFTRTDVVVGIGGGAVTDLAGFVAACWLRGVRVVQLPTSILGMVDAAVGGKTGVNTPSGKNLVGAFHPPAAVLCDLSTLDTLPESDRTAGLAEIVKCGYIADPRINELITANPKAATDPAGPLLANLVRRAVAVKAEVVSEDLKESGRRAILNYGHTFAHAIEKVEDYSWRHGDAVAVGMVYASVLGRLTGRVDLVDHTRDLLTAVGLPTSYRGAPFEQLLAAMRVDKKAVGNTLRFILLDEVARPALVDDVTEDQLRQAYVEVSS
ncbi:3-dehydroquinate synthase [Stackebrandtia nassauensis]|uniref:Multifunctional fusion protein n=1 Tax=Stackebrandtia nassauensis (strain DSM 44728 / CIP 108903 / NRRL B-16338 / NBRC 102104 / LLR-40K-21) TaxID=446470 RepID=D3QBD1_STANL|nr:3-dehydroquinate synthase [Stackebrandtia nassauensis]ADD42813.1 3-dehydroquinate synthase [Stackebrandtia nassauensis DSM 44728]